MSKYRRWTKEEDIELIRLYKNKTLIELGELFNRHWNKVCRRAIILGIKKDKIITNSRISETHKNLFKLGVRSNKGDKNPNWKGGIRQAYAGIDPKIYSSVHRWLRKTYGIANGCESKSCSGISANYQWALKKGREYEKKRDNFIILCKSCHTKYDLKK